MNATFRIRSVRIRGRQRWELDLRPVGQGRLFYRTRAEAETEKRWKEREIQDHGAALADLSPAERVEIVRARKRLAEAGATITQAVDFFLEHSDRIVPMPLAKAAEACITAKESAGRRERYVRQFAGELRRFAAAHPDKLCSDVSRADIEAYIHSEDWEMRTKAGKLIDLGTFFTWAKKLGYVRMNPVHGIERITPEHKVPGILTPEQARRLMETTRSHAPTFLPYVTLCLFAGLRPAEVFRVTWESIDLDRGTVRVESLASKTRQRRIVELEPNALQWLRLAREVGGVLPPKNWQRYFDRIRDLAGIREWPQDAMRHSYVSYSLPVRGAMRTAENAGHSEAILYRHYRELVTPEAAREFWNITP